MKTLVIHPTDESTAFLSQVYEGKDWTVITDPRISKSKLREAMLAHDRIIMMGHGTPQGLIRGNIYDFSYVINSEFVDILREKDGVYIWCYANEFVERYKLKGFVTGMIVSEWGEADALGIIPDKGMINESNVLFTQSITDNIHLDAEAMAEAVRTQYTTQDNNIILFNQENIHYFA